MLLGEEHTRQAAVSQLPIDAEAVPEGLTQAFEGRGGEWRMRESSYKDTAR
jgi:hypothetical protein